MRSFWFWILLAFSCTAYALSGFVNDNANVIDASYEQEITNTLQGLHDAQIAEFVVVTIESLEGRDIEGYAFELAEGKIGDPTKNNGLLLLVAVKDRQYRFEVGRGLEPILNDAKIGRVGRDYLVPNFKNGDYGKGISEAVKAVNAILNGTEQVQEYQQQDSKVYMIFMIIFWIFIIGIPILKLVLRILKKTKILPKEYFEAALIAALMSNSGSGRHSGGGFRGGGGFSGGGHFGGGGASGRW